MVLNILTAVQDKQLKVAQVIIDSARPSINGKVFWCHELVFFCHFCDTCLILFNRGRDNNNFFFPFSFYKILQKWMGNHDLIWFSGWRVKKKKRIWSEAYLYRFDIFVPMDMLNFFIRISNMYLTDAKVYVLQLDHMRNKTRYVKTIQRWCKELSIVGALVFCLRWIFLILQGDEESIKVRSFFFNYALYQSWFLKFEVKRWCSYQLLDGLKKKKIICSFQIKF